MLFITGGFTFDEKNIFASFIDNSIYEIWVQKKAFKKTLNDRVWQLYINTFPAHPTGKG